MKGLTLLILIVAFLTSCNQKHPFEGVWITVSHVSENGHTTSAQTQNIFDFEHDSLKIVQLGNHASGNLREITMNAYKYEFINDRFVSYWEKDTIYFSYQVEDSLILNFNTKEERTNQSVVLKRIDFTKKLKQPLKGSYLLKWPENSTSLTFINDSIAVGFDKNHGDKWKIFNYKGAHLFLYLDGITPISSIWNESDTILNLTYHLKPNRKVTLKKANSTISPEDLYGEWTRIDKSLNLPPPSPEIIFELKMTFDPDTLTTHYYNEDKKEAWQLTEDGKNIYFPDRVLKNGGVWNMLNFNAGDDTIQIKQGYENTRTWFRSPKI